MTPMGCLTSGSRLLLLDAFFFFVWDTVLTLSVCKSVYGVCLLVRMTILEATSFLPQVLVMDSEPLEEGSRGIPNCVG